jgi:hypothetical protein
MPVIGDCTQALALQVEQSLSEIGAFVLIQLCIGRIMDPNVVFQLVEKDRRGPPYQLRETIAGQGVSAVIAQVDAPDYPVFVPDRHPGPGGKSTLKFSAANNLLLLLVLLQIRDQ